MTFLTASFFVLVSAIIDIYPIVIAVDVIGIVMILFMEKFEPRTFILWLMIIIVLPLIGFGLYLLLGCTLYSGRIFDRKRESDLNYLEDTDVHDVDGQLPRMLRAAGADICTSGNDVRIYWNIWNEIDDLIDDLGAAESSIRMEMRRVPRGDAGARMIDTLAERAGSGVDVRITTGLRGFGRTRGMGRLKRSGGVYRSYHNPIYSTLSVKNRNRGMRFIAIVDGKIAYTGQDTIVRITGPAVDRLGRRFEADWAYASHGKHDAVCDRTAAEPGSGDAAVQILAGGPDVSRNPNPVVSLYSSIISDSRESLLISMPYLVPDENMYNAIRLAKLSGADVHVLIPRHGSHWYQPWNSLAASNRLMSEGVRVYFTKCRSTRCVIISDGRICSIGSAAFNTNSMYNDFTISTLLYSESAASYAEMEFREELVDAVECMSDDYRKRSLMDRLKVAMSRVMMLLN